MRRVLGEIVVVAMAVPLSFAVLSPGVEVIVSGVLPGPRDTAFLILGMVYAMVAPIGYFLAEAWWRRGLALIGAALAAAAVGEMSYLFETKRSTEGLALLFVLVCAVSLLALAAAMLRRARQREVARVEDVAVETVLAVAHDAYGAYGAGGSSDSAQTARLAEHLALAAVWTAAREADDGADACFRIDQALAVLETDFSENTVISAGPFAAHLIGKMRRHFSPSGRVVRREGGGRVAGTARAPLFQPL